MDDKLIEIIPPETGRITQLTPAVKPGEYTYEYTSRTPVKNTDKAIRILREALIEIKARADVITTTDSKACDTFNVILAIAEKALDETKG